MNRVKNINEIISILESINPYLVEKFNISEIGVFGSYVKNLHIRRIFRKCSSGKSRFSFEKSFKTIHWQTYSSGNFIYLNRL